MSFFNWRDALPKPKKEDKIEVENLNRKTDKSEYKIKLTLDLVVEGIKNFDIASAIKQSKIYFDNPSVMEVLELYYDTVEIIDEVPVGHSLNKQK